MKHLLKFAVFLGVIIINCSCSAPKYIHDSSSYNRQKELINTRSANVFGEILIGSLTVVSSVYFGDEVEFQPIIQNFKKLNLKNVTNDTIYVNMLTDIFWDENDYCDFMDIRIPPNSNCRILVPLDAEYNVYFSKTPESDDDEMLKINTKEHSKLTLTPGITSVSNSKY